ncbi:MAG: MT-A70 family methyltransferase [Acidithiobacillus sp.]
MSISKSEKKVKVPRTAFIQRIEQVRKYMELTNSGWVPTHYRFPEWTGITGNFGAWAVWVRQAKKKGKLGAKQVEALDRLGFIWGKDDVEKVLSRTQIKHGAPESDAPFDPGRERKNSVLRASRHRADSGPDTVRDVGAAEDLNLSFGLFYSDVITKYARADTDVPLAKQNTGRILSRLQCLELDRIAMDDATILLWAPPSLFYEIIDLFDHWRFSFAHAGYWRKGVKPGHCHTRESYEYYLVGKRGDPSWGLTTEYGRFLRGYVGSHIQHENRIIEIFHAACEGPALEVFGTEPRPGWTILPEPEPKERRVDTLLRRTVEPSVLPQLATNVI